MGQPNKTRSRWKCRKHFLALCSLQFFLFNMPIVLIEWAIKQHEKPIIAQHGFQKLVPMKQQNYLPQCSYSIIVTLLKFSTQQRIIKSITCGPIFHFKKEKTRTFIGTVGVSSKGVWVMTCFKSHALWRLPWQHINYRLAAMVLQLFLLLNVSQEDGYFALFCPKLWLVYVRQVCNFFINCYRLFPLPLLSVFIEQCGKI